MTPDPQQPETLLSVPTEVEAAALVTALAEYDVKALAVGGYTSGFKAEAPGCVAVVVKHADLDRAKQVLTNIRQQGQDDESDVELHRWTLFKMIVNDFWWFSVVFGIVVSLLAWMVTQEEATLVVEVIVPVLFILLILALSRSITRHRKLCRREEVKETESSGRD